MERSLRFQTWILLQLLQLQSVHKQPAKTALSTTQSPPQDWEWINDKKKFLCCIMNNSLHQFFSGFASGPRCYIGHQELIKHGTTIVYYMTVKNNGSRSLIIVWIISAKNAQDNFSWKNSVRFAKGAYTHEFFLNRNNNSFEMRWHEKLIRLVFLYSECLVSNYLSNFHDFILIQCVKKSTNHVPCCRVKPHLNVVRWYLLLACIIYFMVFENRKHVLLPFKS